MSSKQESQPLELQKTVVSGCISRISWWTFGLPTIGALEKLLENPQVCWRLTSGKLVWGRAFQHALGQLLGQSEAQGLLACIVEYIPSMLFCPPASPHWPAQFQSSSTLFSTAISFWSLASAIGVGVCKHVPPQPAILVSLCLEDA